MYLRCDGVLTFSNQTEPRCDNWTLVTPEQLIGEAIMDHQLSDSEVTLLGGVAFTVFLTVLGVRGFLRAIRS